MYWKEKVKDLIKDVHENGVKSDYKEPKLYDVVPKEEIAEFEEVMREIIADIVSELQVCEIIECMDSKFHMLFFFT